MVTLYELAFSSLVYSELTDYERSYLDFRGEVGGTPDLAKSTHRDSLLDWLNKWGCRFDTSKLPDVSATIKRWYRQYEKKLCTENRGIWELDNQELDALAAAYEGLQNLVIFKYERAGKEVVRHFGPTAASKVLFALRPQSAIAWDDMMRKGMRDSSRDFVYRQFLERAKNDCIDLIRQCKKLGIQLIDIPATLNRNEATLAQLIGEYYWAKHTRGIEAPSLNALNQWMKWSLST